LKVFDAAFLQGDRGATDVEAALIDGGVCGAANWSEVAQKIRAHGRSWAAGEGLSLADRLCMALGDRLDADILTADQAWGTGGRLRQVR
jgi:ribonuclease VapC